MPATGANLHNGSIGSLPPLGLASKSFLFLREMNRKTIVPRIGHTNQLFSLIAIHRIPVVALNTTSHRFLHYKTLPINGNLIQIKQRFPVPGTTALFDHKGHDDKDARWRRTNGMCLSLVNLPLPATIESNGLSKCLCLISVRWQDLAKM